LLVTNEPTEETKEEDKLEALARAVEKPGGSI
jgi:hypothetical protein